MKKGIILSAVILSVIILVSLGFSTENTKKDENFVPVEKGKMYKVMALDRTLEMKVLEKPKGNWVKVKITKRDV